MTPFRRICIDGRPLGAVDGPAVCLPLVSRTASHLAAEAARANALAPDLLEWRADFFERLDDPEHVVDAARAIRGAAPGVPLLYTRRSENEGGEPVSASEDQLTAGYRRICEERLAELVDCEVAAVDDHWNAIRTAASASGRLLVGSFHDFAGTPEPHALLERFAGAGRRGADIAKVAVMPRDPGDVLRLLQATLEASGRLGVPVIGMAMGPLGVVSRVFGHQFGSALTFAAGDRASAPGQLPIAALRNILAAIRTP
jgi:3-dehydroquinate dehydratase-1